MPFTKQQFLDAGLPCESVYIDDFGNQQYDAGVTLTPEQWAVAEGIINPKKSQQSKSATFATAIPNWATWTQVQGQEWYDANLGNGHVDAILNLADAKVFMKKQNAAILRLMQMVIALRDFTGIIKE